MPEPMVTSASMAEMSGGFFIWRSVSPVAAAACRPRRRRPRVLPPVDKEENVEPEGLRRKSPLPVWYPRKPLGDITTIVRALEAERARRAQQRRIDAETSPEILALVNPTSQQEGVPATGGLPSELSDAPASSTLPAATTPLPHYELQASSPARQTLVTITGASPAVPQQTPETHQMLCSKLNEIEKSAMAYMKRAPKQPSKMITARRTVMSMR